MMVPYQKWCGQTQSHNPHIWADIKSNSLGLYLECAGHTGETKEITCTPHSSGQCTCALSPASYEGETDDLPE